MENNRKHSVVMTERLYAALAKNCIAAMKARRQRGARVEIDFSYKNVIRHSLGNRA